MILFFLAILTGLQTEASELQVKTAILLDEKGEPRCRVGEFHREDAQIGPTAFDDLRECDERDELYARLALETEEISYGVVAPPSSMAAKVLNTLIPGAAIGVLSSCLVVILANAPFTDMNNPTHSLGIASIGLGVFVGGFFASGAIAVYIAGAKSGLIPSTMVMNVLGLGLGLLACGGPRDNQN